MRPLKALIAAICLACTVTAAFSLQGALAQNQIYGVDISPDGKTYAILKQYGEQPIVAIYDVDNPAKPPVAVSLGDIETGQFAWGGNNHVLVQGFGEQEGVNTSSTLETIRVARWLSVSKDNGKVVTLFGENQLGDYFYILPSSGTLLSTLPDEPDTALFARSTLKRVNSGPTRMKEGNDSFILSLLAVNLKSSNAKRTESGREVTIDWVVNEKGDAIARIDTGSTERDLIIFARPSGKGSFGRVAEFDLDEGPISDMSFYGAAERDGAIQTLVTDRTGHKKLVEFDLNTGAFGETIFEPGGGTINNILFNRKRGKASAVYYYDGGGRIYHIDNEDRADQERLQGALPDAGLAIISKSLIGERMIVKASYSGKPAEYYLYDKPGKRLEMIATE